MQKAWHEQPEREKGFTLVKRLIAPMEDQRGRGVDAGEEIDHNHGWPEGMRVATLA
ncbi:hypothetical protein Acr_26g0011380 [Actinidia rufa]|uniref:Uncharacterized protein n=1 Tax=Actinidia rufa TaxID=165716 RepID=A0A7J0H4B3_9ERIC|nr:hypothetical protein Acr_26g0011380 [Actinidia rufa]